MRNPELREGLHLASDFEAVQELPRESELLTGIFFTQKAVDIFRLIVGRAVDRGQPAP